LRINKKIDSLSTGNKKKVAIVQALLHEPRLLILDEPTGGLDPLMQNKFFEVLKEENKKGVTIFFSSHILSEVQKMCSRVAIIKEGRILKVGAVEDLTGNKFKKVKVEFKNEQTTESFKLSGMRDAKLIEKGIEFLFSGRMDEMLRKLNEMEVENLWIEEPSLEEVFMHYYEKEGTDMIIFQRELKRNFKSFTIWTVLMLVMFIYMAYMYPSMADQADKMQDIMKSFPEGLLEAFNIDLMMNLSDVTSYFAGEGYVFWLLFGSIYAMILASGFCPRKKAIKQPSFYCPNL
jgi:energy-coupling factor transporter ATP-binding protein EcfA2